MDVNTRRDQYEVGTYSCYDKHQLGPSLGVADGDMLPVTFDVLLDRNVT
jgi:hypothetical protein